jgi:monoamine oxidase
MGVVNKFLLIWNSPFWNKNLHYIGVSPNEKGKFNYFLNLHHFSNNNALVTFAYGKFAELTETMTESECIEEIMQNLKIIHGNNIPYPSSFYRTRWGQNPHILGSYSYVSKMGKSSDFDVLATQVQNKLFFAGEHTSRDYRGTVHGAYLSGIREADKIFNLI